MSALIRPSIDEYFMEIATVVAKRSTCLRNHVGALFVKNKRILSTGYNGAPAGLVHCDVVGCARQDVASGTRHELCRAVHAEQNAIIQAALHGISIEGATLYCTHQPCILCAKMMINARVAKVVYKESYPDGTALAFLEQAGIGVERV
jgi:dCMP deaminase